MNETSGRRNEGPSPYRDSMLAASLSMRAEATHTIPRMSSASRKSITKVSNTRAFMPWGRREGQGALPGSVTQSTHTLCNITQAFMPWGRREGQGALPGSVTQSTHTLCNITQAFMPWGRREREGQGALMPWGRREGQGALPGYPEHTYPQALCPNITRAFMP